MTTTAPSFGLLRAISDETVMRALLDAGRATRAELAATTGLSKPTVTESVRRLEARSLVVDTGQKTGGRGGVGSYYAPSGAGRGFALAVDIAPSGIVVEAVDATGTCIGRAAQPVTRPIATSSIRRQLRSTARAAIADLHAGAAECAVVSAADPVDRGTGRLVQLPDAPFLVGDLDPVTVLRSVVNGPVLVDNDVNWAAHYEHARRDTDDFAYLFLGEGLGCAVVSDGQVRRGHAGLAGEVAHLLTRGPDGRAMPFTAVFAELGVRQPGSTAVNTDALLTGFDDAKVLDTVSTAVASVVSALVALTDPALVVLAGPWGTDPRLLACACRTIRSSARPIELDLAHEPNTAALAGARAKAIEELRSLILARTRG